MTTHQARRSGKAEAAAKAGPEQSDARRTCPASSDTGGQVLATAALVFFLLYLRWQVAFPTVDRIPSSFIFAAGASLTTPRQPLDRIWLFAIFPWQSRPLPCSAQQRCRLGLAFLCGDAGLLFNGCAQSGTPTWWIPAGRHRHCRTVLWLGSPKDRIPLWEMGLGRWSCGVGLYLVCLITAKSRPAWGTRTCRITVVFCDRAL